MARGKKRPKKKPSAAPRIIPYSPDLARFAWTVVPTLVQPEEARQKAPKTTGVEFLEEWVRQEREALEEASSVPKEPSPYRPRNKKRSRAPLRARDNPRDVRIGEIKAWCNAEEAEWSRNKDGSYDAMAIYPSLELAQLAAGTVPGGNVKIAYRIVTTETEKKTPKGKIIDLTYNKVNGGYVDSSPYVFPEFSGYAISQLAFNGLNEDYPVALLVFWAPLN